MTNTEEPAAAQERDDLEEVYRLYAEGKRVTDLDLIRRIRERSEAARRAVFKQRPAGHRRPFHQGFA